MAIRTAWPTCLRNSKAITNPFGTVNLSLPGGAELFLARLEPSRGARGTPSTDYRLNCGHAHKQVPPEVIRTVWIHPKLLDTLRQAAFERVVGAFNDAEHETI
jgi:hypothetical protein